MTTLGWIFMLTSVGAVWGMTIWCFRKVLTTKDDSFVEPPDALGG